MFRKKNRTGTGSFLAASGVNCIQYDGHRRIRLPYIGSVRMTRSLPKGIPYEVTIRKRNGRWYASVAYWQPSMAPPLFKIYSNLTNVLHSTGQMQSRVR